MIQECGAVEVDAATLTSALSGPVALPQLLDTLSEGVYLVDRNRTILTWNRACEEISGYSAEEVIGRRCFDNILRHVDADGTQLCRSACPLAETMLDGQPRSCHVWLHHKDGHRRPVKANTTPIRDPDTHAIIGGLEAFTDETVPNAAREHAARLEHLVVTDPLTGLPNRRYLDFALPTALAEALRHGQPLAIAFADIDHFKAVNDRYGHEVGDRMLKVIAGTLAASLRASDTVCRYGGEEFLVILPHTGPTELANTCQRLLSLVRASGLDLEGQRSVSVTISIGATIASPGDSHLDLLHRADELLYTSKRSGRDRATCAWPGARG